MGRIDESGAVLTDDEMYTNPDVAIKFIQETGVDALAVSYGSTHGDYPEGYVPTFHFDIVEKIKAATGAPLVLHGGSGAGEENMRRSVEAGINKINVDTDIRLAVTRNMRELFEREPELKESSLAGVWQLLDEKREQFDPRAFLPPVYDLVMYGTVADEAQEKLVAAIEAGVKEAVGTLIVQFGSYGKAPLVKIATLDEMAERYAKEGR